MIQPLVSISVASYNNAHLITETLDSIFNQTYRNIELVVVDDFSTDNSIEIINKWVAEYGHRFQHVELIQHEKNKGVCAAANSMVKNSKGDFISYIASDDTMLPDKTEKQLALLQQASEEVGMVYSDAYLMDEESNPIYGWFIQRYRQDFVWPPSGWLFEELLNGNFIPAMSVMIKKEVFDDIGYFDETLVFEDYDMWLRIALKYKIVYSEVPSVRYRIRKSSLIHTIKSWNPSLIKIFLKFQDRKDVQEKLIEIAKTCYNNNDRESLKHFQQLTTKIPAIEKIMRLHRLGIPHLIGKRIVYRTK